MAEHISRKELKQDKIHDVFEQSAEAVYTHKQVVLSVVVVALIVAIAYGGWTVYHDRQTAAASAEFDVALRAYNGPIAGATQQPPEPGETTYPDEQARANDAEQKFAVVADKYPHTKQGKLARYYEALCLENLERQNQAMEALKKLSTDSDKELASMANYQIATIDARTGKTDEAIKIYRALADKGSVFVPRSLALLDLAGILRVTNPKEAAVVYQQIKKEFPDTAIADEADRGLELIAPKS